MAEFIKLISDALYRIPSNRPGFFHGLKHTTGLSNPIIDIKRSTPNGVLLFYGKGNIS